MRSPLSPDASLPGAGAVEFSVVLVAAGSGVGSREGGGNSMNFISTENNGTWRSFFDFFERAGAPASDF